ncbi:MAG: ribonuclease Z [Candidatus Thorarchaeota archaeon]|nr:ribonuclease Z [Candidatus Thorarchaeota archaeon]
MLDLVFLGTGGSMPTENRNLPAIAIRFEGWIFLFDAGEDVQRQFETAQLGLNKNMAIFISHMHADHVLGLAGLLLRFSLLGRQKPLKIYGPKELIEFVKVNQSTINLGTTFETTVHAIEPGLVFQEGPVNIRAFPVDHRGYALGYEFTIQKPTGEFLPEKAEDLGVPKGPLWGKLADGESVALQNGSTVSPDDVTGPAPKPLRVVYSGDTRPCRSLRDAMISADIAISEAMYTVEHADLAEERGHSTAKDIAEMALESGVKLLILTHYSPRYFDGTAILEEGQSIFPNTILARDLLHLQMDKYGNSIVIKSGLMPPTKDQT